MAAWHLPRLVDESSGFGTSGPIGSPFAPPRPSRDGAIRRLAADKFAPEHRYASPEVVFCIHPDQSEQVPAMIERYKA